MNDNSGVFYVEYDKNRRNYKVKVHLFGERQDQDLILYEECDPGFNIGIHSSKD